MARGLRRRARGGRQHARHRRGAATSSSSSASYQFPVFQVPRGRHARGRSSSATRAPGSTSAWTRCAHAGGWTRRAGARLRGAARDRARRHQADGLRRLLPDRRRLHQLGEAPGHPGRPGPRLGGRQPGGLGAAHHRPRPDPVQPALRALPQSRAQVDARHRRRLLLRAARRGDPLRAREVRRGPRRADHHLRDAEGEGGDQGRRPRPRLHLRRDRPHRQALSRRRSRARTSRSPRRSRWSRACASCATRASARSSSSTYALTLEGLLRHASKHAAGIVIAPRPLVEDLPLCVDKDGAVMTQYAVHRRRGDRPDQVRLPRPQDADADRTTSCAASARAAASTIDLADAAARRHADLHA